MRDRVFRDTLVDQFVQCIGIYPVGSLVELNSGEVAVVIGQNRVRRLKPRVMVLLAPTRAPMPIRRSSTFFTTRLRPMVSPMRW